MDYISKVDLSRNAKLFSGDTANLEGSLTLGENLIIEGDVVFSGLTTFSGATYKVLLKDNSGKVYESDSALGDSPLNNGIYKGKPIATRNLNGINIGDLLSGRTYDGLFADILAPYTPPTITSVLTPQNSNYNELDVDYDVTFTWVRNIGTPDIISSLIQYQREGDSVWKDLNTTLISINTDTYTSSGNLTLNTVGVNNSSVIFKAFFTDTTTVQSATITGTFSVYVEPTKTQPITSVTREMGDVQTILSSTVTRNSVNTPLLGYIFQYQLNNGVWEDVGTYTSFVSPMNNTVTANFNTVPINTSSIGYRIAITDTEGITYSSIGIVSLVYKSFLGYNPNTTIDLPTLLGMDNFNLTNSKSRSITVTAINGNFCYYGYNAGDGNLNNILKNNGSLEIGAWTKLDDLMGVNSFGAIVTYRVYKTNSTNAYTNNLLVFN